MNHVFIGYFTPEIIKEIRATSLYFKIETWNRYRDYHNIYEKITPENTELIMNDFKIKCETIAVLPKNYVTCGNLLRLFGYI